MIEEPRRNLRVRKNPKYLNSDEQDPDKVSFSQLKSHYDYSQSNAQKALDAKTLVKFLNTINKSCRQTAQQLLSAKLQAQKKVQKVQTYVHSKPDPNIPKKTTSLPKQVRSQVSKKPKSAGSVKEVSKPSYVSKDTQQYIKKLKQMGSISSVSEIGKGLFTDQLQKLQSLYPDMKNLNYESLNQRPSTSLLGPFQKQPRSKPTQLLQKPATQTNEYKLFKRSGYHVAIAYHIYLRAFSQSGKPLGPEIDPTYFAKKLKQESLVDGK